MEGTSKIKQTLFNEIIKSVEYETDTKREWSYEEFDKVLENIYTNTSLFKNFDMYNNIYKFTSIFSSDYRKWTRLQLELCINTILKEFTLSIKGGCNGNYIYRYISKLEPKVY